MGVWLKVRCMYSGCLVSSHLMTFAFEVLCVWIILRDIPVAERSHVI